MGKALAIFQVLAQLPKATFEKSYEENAPMNI
jgi:hypothetical protein